MKQYVPNGLIRGLARIGGARRDVLAKFPHALGPAVAIGLAIVLTSLFAAATMGYAAYGVFLGTGYAALAALPIGTVWGMFVMGLDRAIVIGVDKSRGVAYQITTGLIRAALAIAIGIAVSKPLLLLTVSDQLDIELRDRQNAAINAAFAANAKGENLEGREALAESTARALDNQQAVLNAGPTGFEYQTASVSLRSAETAFNRDVPALMTELRNTQNAIAGLRASARSARDSADLAQLLARSQTLGQQVATHQTNRARAQERLDRAVAAWRTAEEGKRVRLDSAHAAAASDAAGAKSKVAGLNAKDGKELSRLHQPSLANRYTILKDIENNPKHHAAKTLRMFELGFDILLILVELTPLTIKMCSRRTSLDDANAAAEFVETEHANLDANLAVTVMQAEAQRIAPLITKLRGDAHDMLIADFMRRLRKPGISRAEILELLKELNTMTRLADGAV
jgi:hypothetical protein